MYACTTNGSGRAPCRPSIGSSRMSSNKRRRKPYYDEDSRWKEVTWTLTSPSSNKQYNMRDSIKTIHWYLTNSRTGYQRKCTKISTLINNPARTSNGDMKPLTSKKHLYTFERDLTVGAPHPHPRDLYQINGGEPPGTITQWTPLKEGFDRAWLTLSKFLKNSKIVHHNHGSEMEEMHYLVIQGT